MGNMGDVAAGNALRDFVVREPHIHSDRMRCCYCVGDGGKN